MKVIRKIGLAVFKDKKVMMVRDNKNDTVFYIVGGKVEEGESDIECLKREVLEEIGVEVEDESIKFLQEFEDIAHNRPNTILNLKVFTAKIIGEPKPLDEIVEIRYFDSSVDPKHQSEIARNKLFPWLKKNGYID